MHSKQRLFNTARFEHEKEMRRKTLKQKKFGIQPFLESGIHWAGILESSTRNPESTGWNPESKAVMNSLTWGKHQKLYLHENKGITVLQELVV